MEYELKNEKIGEILVGEGAITQKECEDALNLQKQTGLKLGETLLSLGSITQEQLLDALEKQAEIFSKANIEMENKRKRLGEILIEQELISEKQFEEALEKQKASDMKLGEILISENLVTESHIMNILETQLGIKSVDVSEQYIDPEIVFMIPEKICREHEVIALEVLNGELLVAMSDPLDYYAVDDIKSVVPLPIKTLIGSSKKIITEIDNIYTNVAAERAVEEFARMYSGKEDKKEVIADIEEEKELLKAPIVRFINSKIEDAVRNGVSDIHFEPGIDGIRIRYRIDGTLHEDMKIDSEILNALVSRTKIMSNMNIAEKRIPQDGRIQYKIADKIIDLRVSTLPGVYGEKIVMRVLDKTNFVLSKDRLGFTIKEQNSFGRMITKPFGIILVTGPTGSGKTSTLYCALAELNDVARNIITLEDPVEYELDGINQVQLNPKANLTFATGLRSILRQDPDIMMVGEIRDSETAEIAIRAAMTGHLVLSTLHTNDAPSTITRLVDMGIEPFLVSASLNGIIAQRLVKKICSGCRKPYEADERERRILDVNDDSEATLYKGAGCKMCNYTGYRGRVAIFEMMEMEKNLRNLVDKRATIGEIQEEALRLGMTTLRESCKAKVFKGETTVEELLRLTFIY